MSTALVIGLVANLMGPTSAPAQQDQRTFFRYGVQGLFGNNPPPQPPSQSTLSVTVAPANSDAFVGQTYASTTTVGNATGTVTYALINASPDPSTLGLSFDPASGSITGTLSVAGATAFQVRATDSTGATGTSGMVRITAVQPAVQYPVPGGVIAGAPYQIGPASTNIPSPVFVLTDGPAGASINQATGVITGVAPAGGPTTLNFVVKANNQSITATGTVQQEVQNAFATVTLSPPSATVTAPVSGQASTNIPSPTWSLENAPVGLTINPATGIISGSVATPGTYNFSARAESPSGATATSSPVSLTVAQRELTVSVTPPTVNMKINETVTMAASTSGAVGAVTYSIAPLLSSLDAIGMSHAGGVVSGRANARGNVTFRIMATDSEGATGYSPYLVINVDDSVMIYEGPASIVEGSDFTFTLRTGLFDPAAYFFMRESGYANVTVNGQTGAVTGFAGNVDVDSPISLFVTGLPSASGWAPITGTVSLVVQAGAVSATVPAVTTTQTALNVQATSTIPNSSFTLVNAPAGLTINSAGLLTGTISTAGTYQFQIVAENPRGARATRTVDIRVDQPQAPVTPSNVCFDGDWNDRNGEYVVPPYNRLRIYAVGGGGGGGNADLPGERRDGTRGYPSFVQLANTNVGGVATSGGGTGGGGTAGAGYPESAEGIFAPAGLGGESTTATYEGRSLTSPSPTFSQLPGTVSFARAGNPGAQGFLTTQENPVTDVWARGGSTSRNLADPARFMFAWAYSGGSSANAWDRYPGVGGTGKCYAPLNEVRPQWNNAVWSCSAGGSAGSEIEVTILKDDANALQPGTRLFYFAGRYGTPYFSPAGSGGPGRVCFTVD
jgi:hypothetical protein